MKTILATLSLLLVGLSCWCQRSDDTKFLKGIYVLSSNYSIQDDTIFSIQNASAAIDSVDEYYFFSSVRFVRQADTLTLNANIGSIFKAMDPVSGSEKFIFNGCTPYVEFSKIGKDSCWRGLYASERTGYCEAIMTVENGVIRIAGIGKRHPIVFFTCYKASSPTNEAATMIRDILEK